MPSPCYLPVQVSCWLAMDRHTIASYHSSTMQSNLGRMFKVSSFSQEEIRRSHDVASVHVLNRNDERCPVRPYSVNFWPLRIRLTAFPIAFSMLSLQGECQRPTFDKVVCSGSNHQTKFHSTKPPRWLNGVRNDETQADPCNGGIDSYWLVVMEDRVSYVSQGLITLHSHNLTQRGLDPQGIERTLSSRTPRRRSLKERQRSDFCRRSMIRVAPPLILPSSRTRR